MQDKNLVAAYHVILLLPFWNPAKGPRALIGLILLGSIWTLLKQFPIVLR